MDYDVVSGVWKRSIFPASKPSSRQDAVLLEQWLTEEIQARTLAAPKTEDGAPSTKEAIEAILPVLNMAMHELLRQVMLHCSERGQLLRRIWVTFLDLFHHTQAQMERAVTSFSLKLDGLRATIQRQKDTYAERVLEYKKSMLSIQERNERLLQAQLKPLKDELARKSESHATLEKFQRDVREWFPRFPVYRDSVLQYDLAPYLIDGVVVGADDALMADAKRCLDAIVAAGQENPARDAAIARRKAQADAEAAQQHRTTASTTTAPVDAKRGKAAGSLLFSMSKVLALRPNESSSLRAEMTQRVRDAEQRAKDATEQMVMARKVCGNLQTQLNTAEAELRRLIAEVGALRGGYSRDSAAIAAANGVGGGGGAASASSLRLSSAAAVSSYSFARQDSLPALLSPSLVPAQPSPLAGRAGTGRFANPLSGRSALAPTDGSGSDSGGGGGGGSSHSAAGGASLDVDSDGDSDGDGRNRSGGLGFGGGLGIGSGGGGGDGSLSPSASPQAQKLRTSYSARQLQRLCHRLLVEKAGTCNTQALAQAVQSHFLQRYGIKKMADAHVRDFVVGVQKHSGSGGYYTITHVARLCAVGGDLPPFTAPQTHTYHSLLAALLGSHTVNATLGRKSRSGSGAGAPPALLADEGSGSGSGSGIGSGSGGDSGGGFEVLEVVPAVPSRPVVPSTPTRRRPSLLRHRSFAVSGMEGADGAGEGGMGGGGGEPAVMYLIPLAHAHTVIRDGFGSNGDAMQSAAAATSASAPSAALAAVAGRSSQQFGLAFSPMTLTTVLSRLEDMGVDAKGAPAASTARAAAAAAAATPADDASAAAVTNEGEGSGSNSSGGGGGQELATAVALRQLTKAAEGQYVELYAVMDLCMNVVDEERRLFRSLLEALYDAGDVTEAGSLDVQECMVILQLANPQLPQEMAIRMFHETQQRAALEQRSRPGMNIGSYRSHFAAAVMERELDCSALLVPTADDQELMDLVLRQADAAAAAAKLTGQRLQAQFKDTGDQVVSARMNAIADRANRLAVVCEKHKPGSGAVCYFALQLLLMLVAQGEREVEAHVGRKQLVVAVGKWSAKTQTRAFNGWRQWTRVRRIQKRKAARASRRAGTAGSGGGGSGGGGGGRK